jgi:hypothetical protein
MGPVATPYRLRPGDTGPQQRSPATCGAACLTVARMLVDPVFASWLTTGEPHPPGAPPGATQDERFAAHELLVLRRTNALSLRKGGVNLPWPRRLGTAPWGAKRELERGASRPGTRYALDVLRHGDDAGLARSFEHLVAVVTEGEPALLYVGDVALPRHVTLVMPGESDHMLEVYDPATGRVSHLRRDALVERCLGLAGWNIPWLVVQPDGAHRVPAHGLTGWVRSVARTPRATASSP